MSTDPRDTLVAEKLSVGLSYTLNADVRRAAEARGLSAADYARRALYAAMMNDGQPFTPMPATPVAMRTTVLRGSRDAPEVPTYTNLGTGEQRFGVLPEKFR